MSIDLTNSGEGLFDILGKFAHLLNTLNTARGTTVAAEALDAINQYKAKSDTTLSFDRAVDGFANSEASWRQGGDGFAGNIAQTCRNLLREFVQADDPSVGTSLTDHLKYLIADMIDQDYYVSSTNTGGTGTGFLTDGSTERDLEVLIAWIDDQDAGEWLGYLEPNDTLTIECTDSDVSGSTFRVTGARGPRNKLAEDFTTAGSGVNRTVSGLTAADSILTNADFNGDWIDLGSSKYAPEGWMITGGTDFSKTDTPVLTAAITGTPTTGQFTLKLHNPATNEYYGTAPIDFDATADTVQTAVQAVPGYGEATVARTGTAPNYTHTITCTGITGDPDAPGTYDSFDTGGVSGGKSTSGSDYAISGDTLVIGSAGASGTTHSLEQTVDLTPGEVYFVGTRYRTEDDSSASGGYVLSLLDAIGGSAIYSLSVSLAGASSNMLGMIGFFVRIPEDTVPPVAVQLKSNSPNIDWYFGEVIVSLATELYPGGPYVALVHGDNPPTVGQRYQYAYTNDFSGAWLLAFDQMFDIRSKRLMLPVSGSTLLNDNLIG